MAAADILIVGGGPAGATASLFLAKAKVPHVIADKATFPRDKVDGNVYGRKVIEILDALNPAYLPELTSQTDHALGCDSARIFTPNGKSFNLRFPSTCNHAQSHQTRDSTAAQSPFFTMNRRHFDQFLVSKLDSHYADQRLGSALIELTRQGDRWQVMLDTAGQITTLTPRLIIAADGAHSTVLQKLGQPASMRGSYDSVQGYFRGVAGFEDAVDRFSELTQGDERSDRLGSHIEGHFLPASNPGFLFITPLAQDLCSVGVVKPQQETQHQTANLQSILHDAMQSHPQLAERFAQCESVSSPRPWPIPMGASSKRPVSGAGYLVTGDAAGLCNPLTCFGTGSAMVAGMLAAQQTIQSVQQQRFDQSTLKAYDNALYDRLQREFQASHMLRQVIRQSWLFNQISSNQPVRKVLRKTLKGTSTLLKRM